MTSVSGRGRGWEVVRFPLFDRGEWGMGESEKKRRRRSNDVKRTYSTEILATQATVSAVLSTHEFFGTFSFMALSEAKTPTFSLT